MAKKGKKERIIMKHILEVRLKHRMFSFLDFKGKLLDHLVNELGGVNVRFTKDGTRIDIANKDLSKVYFVGYENFGLQVEATENFDNFIVEIEKLFNALKSFGGYKVESVSRVGIKSMVLRHCKGDNFEILKQRYKEVVFGNYKVMEEKTSASLSDVTYIFDFEKNNGIANILTGPATKEEAIQKFFGNKKLYNSFDRDNGMFFSIDFAKNKEEEVASLDELGKKVKENIETLKEILEGSINYFKKDE